MIFNLSRSGRRCLRCWRQLARARLVAVLSDVPLASLAAVGHGHAVAGPGQVLDHEAPPASITIVPGGTAISRSLPERP